MLKPSRIVFGVAVVMALASSAAAGRWFRLDVGRSFADPSAGKVKNAVLLVRGLACDDPAAIAMSGTAEGVVNNARQSIPLTLQKLPTPGVYAVLRQWPEGRWVLSLTGSCPGHASASAIVPLDTENEFDRAAVRYFDHRVAANAIEATLSAKALMGD